MGRGNADRAVDDDDCVVVVDVVVVDILLNLFELLLLARELNAVVCVLMHVAVLGANDVVNAWHEGATMATALIAAKASGRREHLFTIVGIIIL